MEISSWKVEMSSWKVEVEISIREWSGNFDFPEISMCKLGVEPG